ncbi:MAG TPA: peptidoglycan-binding protein, partial [Deltaproteobacteria bacterium]|nr:peptidoglycan-binding protein [Deltaproteobacteria bacterium]
KWLTGAPIRPVKCKAFGTKSARKGSNVAQVQSDLKRLGFYHGPIDGNFGPGTRTAIGLFQKACGMQPTLLPDGQTLKKLNAAAARADARSASATLKKEAHYPFNGKGPDETICFVRYARNVILSSDRGSHALHNYSPGTFEEKAAIRHFLTTEGSRRHWHRPFLLPVWPG